MPDGVFEAASVDNVVFVLEKKKPAVSDRIAFILAKAGGSKFKVREAIAASQQQFLTNHGLIFRPLKTPGFESVISRLQSHAPLRDFARVNFGMQLRHRSQFPYDVLVNPRKDELRQEHRPCLGGSDVQRYRTAYSGIYCWFNRTAQSGGCWDEGIQFAAPKVLVRQIGKTPLASLEEEGLCCLNALFMIRCTMPGYSERFILGCINSKLLQLYWTNKYYDFKDTFPKIKGAYLEELPIPSLNPEHPEDKARHDQLAGEVQMMVQTSKNFAAAKTEADRAYYESRRADLDRRIDQLVYQLYGLTPEEIAIVEGKASPQTELEIIRPERPAPNKEQAWADAAHYYSVKEEPPPYGTNN